jgi:hypothetical protein
MVVNEMTPEGQILNDLTLGEYDVVIATAPARDSFDEVQFAEALNLRQVGVAIPDDAIIEYSHLAKKGELAKRIRQITGAEPPTPEQAEVMAMQQQMAIQKLQLEIAQLDADVKKTQTEAALNAAKVQDIAEVDPQVRVAELQGKMSMKEQELALRRELSAATNDIRQGQTETSAATKIATTAMQQSRNNPQPQ